MKFSTRKFQSIGVVLPVAIIGVWISSFTFLRMSADEFTFPIIGFDPRDLLSGHYLQYRIDYKIPVNCEENAEQWCLCIESGKPYAYASEEGRCEALSCTNTLKGRCEGRRFIAGIERYYFPEKYKSKLAVVPGKSTISVSINKSGKSVVKAMQVEDMPLLQWLEIQK